MKNLISVIIPTYNMGLYLREAIDSVLCQGIDPVQVIVIDDHSTDHTAAVAASYGDRITYMKTPCHTGMVSTVRNTGLKVVGGEFIGFLDADDIMKPGKLKDQMDFLNRHPDVKLVFTNMRNFTAEGEMPRDFLADHTDFHRMPRTALENGWFQISHERAVETLMNDNFIGTPGMVLMRRSLIAEVGLFDEELCGSEDLDYWIRIAKANDIGYIEREYLLRRLHGINLSSEERFYQAQVKNADKHLATPLGEIARKRLLAYKARVLFDIGYRAQLKGRRKEAVVSFWRSFRCRPRAAALAALMKAALP